MRVFSSADDLKAAVGETLGASDWLAVTQERVNQFGAATGDNQWIHVDVERAQAESPFGGPIVHGYLTLSLLPMFGAQVYSIEGAKMGINYGSNRVRFPAPVPVGAQIRLLSTLTDVADIKDGSLQLTVEQIVEIKDAPKPALVAEILSRVAF
ncbi:MaoC family dehydratase [Williamsia sp. DF01-3]|uniref:MaoC family dehydratase n=1 Tax=Williamsia sp. DF01-3 TaxID=2934157 RepID=UPI001FF54EF0|nr:MaoC family dehydratase [Williamsia sp. DF01-3]MCK0517381.1 MaoC family dehydratase [Williamsia sp. DF01-3]